MEVNYQLCNTSKESKVQYFFCIITCMLLIFICLFFVANLTDFFFAISLAGGIVIKDYR